jgi:diguanylate cyclase (GGDEF)-like protein/PAS domain S-box-containing protein
MLLNRISLTWLLLITVALVFTLYSIAAVKAPSLAFQVHDQMSQMARLHADLEGNYFKLRENANAIREMLDLNISSERISLDEVYDAAFWVDNRISKIYALVGDTSEGITPPAIEKILRFVISSNIEAGDAEFTDDRSQLEKKLLSLLTDYQRQIVTHTEQASGQTTDKRSLELSNEITKFNVDYDLLVTTLITFFNQPENYQHVVQQLLLEQKNYLDNLKAFSEAHPDRDYMDIAALESAIKKVSFLTQQFYGFYYEFDQQSDTSIDLIKNLKSAWELYDYLLNQQEEKINSMIETEGLELATQIRDEGQTLVYIMLAGVLVIIASLIMFFVIAYRRLNGLRNIALLIASGEDQPSLIDAGQSKDFVSTITRAFNQMIVSLRQRDNEIQEYVQTLSHHGEQLEAEVQSRTEELSNKNLQLNEEIHLRKENEAKLKISSLALANTSEAVVITDDQFHIIEVNAAFCALTGYDYSECVGQTPEFIYSEQRSKEHIMAILKSLHRNGIWSGEITYRSKSGQTFPIWETMNSVTDDAGKITNYIGVFRDISTLKEAEEKLHNLAYYDHLTELPNRSLFYEHLEHEMAVSKRNNNKLAVLFIDLDRFKNVNDTLGHQSGDLLLQQVTQRLTASVRDSDVVSRQGGDEFLILLRDLKDTDVAAVISSKIIAELKEAFIIGDTEVFVGCSIGISIYPDDNDSAENLIKNSDTAMYHAKDNGRGHYEFFNELMNTKNNQRIEIEQRLSVAITEDAFELHYQPQINKHGLVVGAEALIRWNDTTLGIVSPGLFIPIAEDNGQIIQLGQLILQMACKGVRSFKKHNMPAFPVAINLSPKELLKSGFIERLTNTLKAYDVEPGDIELEITETALLDNIDEAKSILSQLSQLGFTIAMDDFGSGYSSLSYIHQLPFDRLKIDQSFVFNIPDDPGSVAISRTIINFAKAMDMTVVAEGVETDKQLEFLWENNCDFCQGYKISRPLPIDDFIQFVTQNNS